MRIRPEEELPAKNDCRVQSVYEMQVRQWRGGRGGSGGSGSGSSGGGGSDGDGGSGEASRQSHDIVPLSGRLVMFRSEILHEVSTKLTMLVLPRMAGATIDCRTAGAAQFKQSATLRTHAVGVSGAGARNNKLQGIALPARSSAKLTDGN